MATLASRELTASSLPLHAIATRFSYGLVLMGFGMWLAHYGFHFMVGALTVVPLAQSFLADFGVPILGAPSPTFSRSGTTRPRSSGRTWMARRRRLFDSRIVKIGR